MNNMVLADQGVPEVFFYKQGDEFTLNAYEEHPSVYIRIDGIFDHPFLDKYYFISFHGICFSGHKAFKKAPYSQGVDEIAISHDALVQSISTVKIDKKRSMKCDSKYELDINDQHEVVIRGTRGVLMAPIPDVESIHLIDRQFFSILYN